MADEPLYCSFCGAEDFGCDCEYPSEDGEREVKYCEVCGSLLSECTCGF